VQIPGAVHALFFGLSGRSQAPSQMDLPADPIAYTANGLPMALFGRPFRMIRPEILFQWVQIGIHYQLQ